MNRKTHLFFDLDDTVTFSRTPIEDDALEVYRSLPCDVVIVSGAHVNQIHTQTRGLSCYRLGQNGNQAFSPDGALLWEELLTESQAEKIRQHVAALQRECTHSVKDPNDLLEHRGSQISYSLLGHHEDVALKKAFDPEKKLRVELLEKRPFLDDELEVRIGGTTCFDYFQKGKNKGYNVKKLIEHMGWDLEDALYFGDSLFPGGNDETVVGVIETVEVKNHRHTLEVLRELFPVK
ncbi:MAG TPA: HAD-IIB family hydrolase [Candidatus Paceibacterota bacterium]|nr:HAD-IIB family hydrolase [Candidatus Paceibacterota bacterium]